MGSNRPLSPHLQIWKWGPHMLVSILHRVSGDGMALVGLFVLVWWLGALASGPPRPNTSAWTGPLLVNRIAGYRHSPDCGLLGPHSQQVRDTTYG